MMNKIPSLEISLQTIQFPLQIFTSDAVITNEFLLIGVNHCWFEQRRHLHIFPIFFSHFILIFFSPPSQLFKIFFWSYLGVWPLNWFVKLISQLIICEFGL